MRMTMNLIMASTPVEMMLCGFGVGASATVIQAHAVAMYGPGFFTGRLISRFGTAWVATVGAALSALCMLVGLQGQGFRALRGGAGTAQRGLELHVRLRHHDALRRARAGERVRAQAANDLIVFG